MLGAIGIATAWIFFLLSPQHRLASELIRGPEVRAVAGTVEHSIPSSFRLTGSGSSMTYYVIGSERRGFLRVVLERPEGELRVKSAVFDEVPLTVANTGARNASQDH